MSRSVSLLWICGACVWSLSCGSSSTESDTGGAGGASAAGATNHGGASANGGANHAGSSNPNGGAAHGGGNTAGAGAGDSAAGAGDDQPGSAGEGGAAGEGGSAGGAEPPPRFEPWALWPMPNAASSGLPHPASYDTKAAGVVVDNVTGLMWQAVASSSTFSWPAAKDHCAALVLGGFSDWRLPSRIELISIVDYTIAKPGPVIDTTAFPGAPNVIFWTASPEALYGGSRAWYVEFDNGFAFTDSSSTAYSARCVR